MSWIVASFVMFCSSVTMYLLVRKSILLKKPSQYNNLAMFAVPLFVFFVLCLITGQSFILPMHQFVQIFLISLAFSYFGNVFSLLSIEHAPNPGYPLVISKSYVVFTTIISILFLNGEFSVKKTIGIIVIVIFSALIMLADKSSKKSRDRKWLPLAFGAFFCWGFLSLSSRYMFDQGINLYVYLFYLYLVVTTCIVLNISRNKINMKLMWENPILYLIIGLLSFSFNYFQFEAIKAAPNIGYVNAINASSISAVTLFAALLFHDELTKRKLIGVIGVTFGLLIILL